MRGYIPKYHLQRAQDLEDALALLSKSEGSLKPLAGGTDIMVPLNAGHQRDLNYLDISSCKELCGIQVLPQKIEIGALTTYSEIRQHPEILKEFPMMVEAAKVTGAIAIQNRGTIGGNIANGSPAADTPPALLAYDAEITLISQKGSRTLPYHEFHQGYKQMDLKPYELIHKISLPRKSYNLHHYRKVGTRNAQAISKICLAICADWSEEEQSFQHLRIAMGSVAPIPTRCFKTEELFLTQERGNALKELKQILRQDISPIDDIRSNQEYRFQVSYNLISDFLQHTNLYLH